MKISHILFGLGAAVLVVGGVVAAKKYFSKKKKLDEKNEVENDNSNSENTTKENLEEEVDDEVVFEIDVDELKAMALKNNINRIEDALLKEADYAINILIAANITDRVDWRKILKNIYDSKIISQKMQSILWSNIRFGR